MRKQDHHLHILLIVIYVIVFRRSILDHFSLYRGFIILGRRISASSPIGSPKRASSHVFLPYCVYIAFLG